MKDDGGAAFPITIESQSIPGYCVGEQMMGLSIRDWFAGQATQEDIEEYMPQTQGQLGDWCKSHGGADANQVRPWAKYKYADAMLAERAKGER